MRCILHLGHLCALCALSVANVHAAVLERTLLPAAGGACAGATVQLSFSAGIPIAGEAAGNTALEAAGYWFPPRRPGSAIEEPAQPTRSTDLFACAPSPSTAPEIRFAVGAGPKCRPVRIEVYSVDGRVVAVPVTRVLGPGLYRVSWSEVEREAGRLPSGIYFIRLVVPEATKAVRTVLMR